MSVKFDIRDAVPDNLVDFYGIESEQDEDCCEGCDENTFCIELDLDDFGD